MTRYYHEIFRLLLSAVMPSATNCITQHWLRYARQSYILQITEAFARQNHDISNTASQLPATSANRAAITDCRHAAHIDDSMT